jgi:cbb3-type cytochrome oxidase maturation protein
MQVLFIVLPLALIMAGVALAAFLWSVRSGQYDDMDTPQIRAILDEPDDGRGSGHAGGQMQSGK